MPIKYGVVITVRSAEFVVLSNRSLYVSWRQLKNLKILPLAYTSLHFVTLLHILHNFSTTMIRFSYISAEVNSQTPHLLSGSSTQLQINDEIALFSASILSKL